MAIQRAQVPQDFATRLDATLRLLGLTRSRLALRLRLNPTAVRLWITGRNVPSVHTFTELESILGRQATRYLSGAIDIPPQLVLKTALQLQGVEK
jgi:transcriptional regulator with XRE-family HTH domain